MNFIEKIKSCITRQELLDREKTVLVALSGGADSMALACVLRAADDIFEPKIFIRLAYFINMAYLCHAFERKGFSGA